MRLGRSLLVAGPEKFSYTDPSGSVLIPALVFLVPVVFDRWTYSVFTVPKATLVLLAAATLLAMTVARALIVGHIQRPLRSVEVVSGFLVVTVLLATVGSPQPDVAWTGVGVRWSGAVSYLAYAVLFWCTARSADHRMAWRVVGALGAAGLVVGFYGLLQAWGHDPLRWPVSSSFGVPTLSTMGNPNLSGALVAITIPASLCAVLDRGRRLPVRLFASAVFACSVASIGVFASLQGQVAVLASCLVLVVWVTTWRSTVLFEALAVALVLGGMLLVVPRLARAGPGPVAASILACVLFAAVFVGREESWVQVDSEVVQSRFRRLARSLWILGPAGLVTIWLVRDRIWNQLGERRFLWEVGLRMVGERPITGHGLETFGTRFSELRSAEHAAVSSTHLSDSVHSVPFGLLIGGGVMLLVVYFGVTVVTARATWRLIRDGEGSHRLLATGLGAAWLAFHLQALVSVDVGGLMAVHWILAGVLLGLDAGMTGRSVVLPWGTAARGRNARFRSTAVFIVTGLLMLGVLPTVTAPWRADRSHHQAMTALAVGEPVAALRHLESAVILQPRHPGYLALTASIHRTRGNIVAAALMSTRAADLRSGDPVLVREAARDSLRLISQAGWLDYAIGYYEELVRMDPFGPGREESAAFFEAIGRDERAAGLRHVVVGDG